MALGGIFCPHRPQTRSVGFGSFVTFTLALYSHRKIAHLLTSSAEGPVGPRRKRSVSQADRTGCGSAARSAAGKARILRTSSLSRSRAPSRLSNLFGDKTTLLVYRMMFGPQRQAPCPMCTSFLTPWNGTAVNLRERVAMVVTARSPVERLIDFKTQRSFSHLFFRFGQVR